MPNTAELSKTATAGKISDAVNGKLAAMRNRTAELLAEVGRLEVRKAAVLQEIRQLDTEASGMLNTEAKRLGIPEGRTWRIEPDGTATVL
jgi:hypothetical protein